MDELFYVEQGVVFKQSEKTVHEDGRVTQGLHHPVAIPHPALGVKAAAIICDLMNAGDQLKAFEERFEGVDYDWLWELAAECAEQYLEGWKYAEGADGEAPPEPQSSSFWAGHSAYADE